MNEKRYPKEIKVKEKDYRVLFMHKLENGRTLGMCDLTNQLLIISKDQDDDEKLATFFHEWLHAIEEEYKLKLGHPKIRKLEWALVELFKQLK